ncbi:MAG: hypothetical protein PHR15_04765 [Atopobiaceae bacterium]|nr:hypothetical protein [Atopobiaceae bacterium]MCH4214977.1 hypothetical protein [Atopobiaceae bacterium]MCI1226893.1 hypothetical protein [Atopobiaceae bacterium]MDD2587828.1 hypothetical protein [Atopobiaceae bacterium]MDD4380772.1 hypothetical protein [Atopobiaceae bacterium]
MKYLKRSHPDGSGSIGRWDEVSKKEFKAAYGRKMASVCSDEDNSDVSVSSDEEQDYMRYVSWRMGHKYDLMPDALTQPGKDLAWDPRPLSEAETSLEAYQKYAAECDSEAEADELMAQSKREEAERWRNKVGPTRDSVARLTSERDRLWSKYESTVFGDEEV